MRSLLLLAVATAAVAQPTLTIDQITQAPETWIGAWPSAPFWTEAGDAPYFYWNPDGQFPADSLYRVGPDGQPEKVSPLQRRTLPPRFDGGLPRAATSPRRAFTRNGDVFVYDPRLGFSTSMVTQTAARESGAVVLEDGSVAYRQGDALFRMWPQGGVQQLTDLRSGSAPVEAAPDSAALYVQDQQRRLLGVVRERVRQDSLRDVARDLEAQDGPPTFYIGSRTVRQLTVDPTGQFVAFTLSDDLEAERTLMVDYVTDSGAAEEISARPKIGGVRT
ncbi:MAG: S9 family peptidase, partial [Rubrivirga sp.]